MSMLLPCLREQGAIFVQPMNDFISVVLKKTTGLSRGSLLKENHWSQEKEQDAAAEEQG